MAITKLFRPEGDHGAPEKLLLDGSVCSYYFSVLFTRHAQCSLYLLTAQRDGGGWHQVITSPVADSDGEITVKIGNFVPGTELNMIFGIQAISDIPSVAVLIVNRETNAIVKVAPKKDKKKLSAGETWNLNLDKFPLQP